MKAIGVVGVVSKEKFVGMAKNHENKTNMWKFKAQIDSSEWVCSKGCRRMSRLGTL